MHFTQRPASTAWEILRLPVGPQSYAWVWFKPQAIPQGLCLQVPVETFRDPERRQPLTLRLVLHVLGIAPQEVQQWSLAGLAYASDNGANPAWDFPLPEPREGVDPTICVFLLPEVISGASANPVAPTWQPTGVANLPELLVRIETDWKASLQLETQVELSSAQLSMALSKVNSLNRDLSFDENRFGAQKDKREWMESRRFLREAATRLQRFIKEQQTGDTSIAGKRNTLEAIYEQFVSRGAPFDGIVRAQRDYEAHRKALRVLFDNMRSVLSAAQDAERRSQMIMSRIASKVRAARSKRQDGERHKNDWRVD